MKNETEANQAICLYRIHPEQQSLPVGRKFGPRFMSNGGVEICEGQELHVRCF